MIATTVWEIKGKQYREINCKNTNKDGEMIEMTLSSRHKIRNSSTGGLRPSTLPTNTDFHTWMGKKHFLFLQTAETGNRAPNSGVKGSGVNHYPRAPAQDRYDEKVEG